MRKYLQITVVLSAFFLLVFVKNLKGSDDDVKIVGNKQLSPSPTEEITKTPPPNPQKTIVPTKALATPTPEAKVVGRYKDGTYDGTIEDAFYGNLQVQAVIKNGQLVDVLPLLYPNDNRTSISINTQAIPMLRDEAVKSQSAQVDIISGASDSSPAFSRSLESALKKAQN